MKITLDGHTYHVSFRNLSEKIVHDQMPDALLEQLIPILFEAVQIQPAKPPKPGQPSSTKIALRMKKPYRPFLKLKPAKRISTTTTTCTISDADGITLATGRAYFSISEMMPPLGHGFDRMKARRKALGRALHEFDRARRTAFLAAYEAQFAERQAKAVRSREQSSATSPSATAGALPTPVAAQQSPA
jgi:hypothetical protein